MTGFIDTNTVEWKTLVCELFYYRNRDLAAEIDKLVEENESLQSDIQSVEAASPQSCCPSNRVIFRKGDSWGKCCKCGKVWDLTLRARDER